MKWSEGGMLFEGWSAIFDESGQAHQIKLSEEQMSNPIEPLHKRIMKLEKSCIGLPKGMYLRQERKHR